MHFPVCFSWGKKNPAVRWPLKFLSSHLHIFHCSFRPPFPHGRSVFRSVSISSWICWRFLTFFERFFGDQKMGGTAARRSFLRRSPFTPRLRKYPGISWDGAAEMRGLWRWFFIGGQDGSSIDHPIWPKPISSYILYLKICMVKSQIFFLWHVESVLSHRSKRIFVSQVKVQREQFAAADAEAKEKTKKAEVRCRIHRISSDLMGYA